jgi:hypothetical protein
MHRLHSIIRQSPAIVISLVALTFSLGTGAGYAASTASAHSSSTKITWHSLKLINKWHEVFASYGAPAYAVSNGVVYLTGAFQGGTTGEFAVLPKGARPKHTLLIATYNDDISSVTSAWVYITPSGQMNINGAADAALSSIDGVSFPAGE